jgi:PhzF family phenazine biosynthesis protein
MRLRRFAQMDVFAHRSGAGNPLAVVLDAEGLSTEDMQAIAAWTNVVETTFLLPPSLPEAAYHLRIFTPQREIPFAGHPSLGSAHAWLEAGGKAGDDDELLQECGAGLLPIHVEDRDSGRRLFFRTPPVQSIREAHADEPGMSAALSGVALGVLPPAQVEAGRRWWLAELADETTLRNLRPNQEAIAAWSRLSDSMGLCVFARCPGQPYQLAVRAFAPAFGISEDPASGAANATIAAWLRHAGALDSIGREYTVSQGREIGRDARIDLRVRPNDAIWVGGETQTVIRGTMNW